MTLNEGQGQSTSQFGSSFGFGVGQVGQVICPTDRLVADAAQAAGGLPIGELRILEQRLPALLRAPRFLAEDRQLADPDVPEAHGNRNPRTKKFLQICFWCMVGSGRAGHKDVEFWNPRPRQL